MQSVDLPISPMRAASLTLIAAASTGLLIPVSEISNSALSHGATLVAALLCLIIVFAANSRNNLLINKPFLAPACELVAIILALAFSFADGAIYTTISLACASCSIALAIISHVSIVQPTAFATQRFFICMSLCIGMFISAVLLFALQLCDASLSQPALAAALLIPQLIVTVLERRKNKASTLQVLSPENVKPPIEGPVHFGAPLMDGFLLGFLPASLSVTQADFHITFLALMLLVGGFFHFVGSKERMPLSPLQLGVESPEQAQKRRAPFLKAVPITLTLFLGVSETVDSILVGVYLVIFAGYFSMLCSSLIERGRFLNISIFHILGRFGGTFIMSFLLAQAVCFAPSYLPVDPLLVNEIRVVLGILFLEGFCSVSMRRGSHLDKSQEAAENSTLNDVDANEEKKHGHWRDRVEAIAQAYDLTARQQEVFMHLARGRNAQFIADELVVSLPTAKSHIYNIYMKLGIHTRQELLDLVDLSLEDVSDNAE